VVPPPTTLDGAAIDKFVQGQIEDGSPVGISLALVKDGQVLLARGYGARSLEGKLPVETNTLFAIGSVSKQFTCACILLLEEEGKLSHRDKVAKYYPDLTRASDISLLDLMNHTSGYTDYYPLDFVDRRMRQPIAPDELIRRYAGGKLDFEPGSRWSYSNTGYILLGRIVEKVAGESFGSFLDRRIFKPLHMSLSFYEPDPADPRAARGYTTFALSPPEFSPPEGSGWLGAAGGIYSTPTDLARWNLALMEGKVLKPGSYQVMTTPRTLSSGKLADYGCGLSLRTQGGRQILSHNGAVSGFATWSAMIPSTRSTLIMMSNQDGGLGSIPGEIFALFFQEPSNVPGVEGASAMETAKTLFAQLQEKKVNRARFSEDYSAYLTEDRIAGAAKRLKPFGKPSKAELVSAHERGGLEVSNVRLTFKSGVLRTLMYRRPDGTIEQFFVYPP